MADVKWIKICTDIFDDEKISLIDGMPDRDGIIVIWFKLLCMAGRQNNGGVFMLNNQIAYTDEMLATIFRRPLNTVRLALKTFEQFGMVSIINNAYTIPNWEKHQSLDKMEAAKEKNRQRVAAHREKQKQIAQCNDYCNVTVTQCNALDKDIDKDIEEDINNKNSAKHPLKADVDSFFDSVWELYPVKKGKGQVSESKRRTLYSIGFEKLSKAIERYLSELKKDADWRKPQNGSTFFNSGYVDYLDENFVPDNRGRKEAIPSWMGKRELDEDELAAIEQMMGNDTATVGNNPELADRAEKLKQRLSG